MANMAYCRFENTLADLRDCYAHLEQNKQLSPREAGARKRLILLCLEIAEDYRHEYMLDTEEEDWWDYL